VTDIESENEVEVIHPERVIQIKGEDITVNEIDFLQGLTAGPLARPLIKDMSTCFEEKGEAITLEEIGQLFSLHREIVFQLMSMVSGKDRDWIMSLNDSDGQTLMLTFWRVNSGFFVRRLLTRKLAAWQEIQDKQAQDKQQAPATPN
jgi:hypothetical protein